MQNKKNLVLNDAQRKTVEEKYWTVPYMVSLMNLPTNTTEDLHGVACIGLCKAVGSFDDTRGVPIDNYICRVIRNELLTALCSKGNKENYLYLEQVSEPSSSLNNPAYIVESEDAKERAIKELKESHQKIIGLMMRDEDAEVVANKCDCSVSTVWHVWGNFKKKLKSELLRRD